MQEQEDDNLRQARQPPTHKGFENYLSETWRVSGSAASIEGALPLTAICSANCAYPHRTEVLSSPPYARYRVFNPKPPSERSPNPKTWGNWEGIGDFCLQKCQRGRQLSPLSEATGLDRNSLRSFRKCIKKRGVAPFGDWFRQFRLSPRIVFFIHYNKSPACD